MAAKPDSSVTLASSWFGGTPAALQDAIVRVLLEAGGVSSARVDPFQSFETVLVDARAAKRLRLSGVLARNRHAVRRNQTLIARNSGLLAEAGASPRGMIVGRRALERLRVNGVVARNHTLVRRNASLVDRNAEQIALALAWMATTRARHSHAPAA